MTPKIKKSLNRGIQTTLIKATEVSEVMLSMKRCALYSFIALFHPDFYNYHDVKIMYPRLGGDDIK